MFQEISETLNNLGQGIVNEPDEFGVVDFELTRRLSIGEIDGLLNKWNLKYRGCEAILNSDGDKYSIGTFSILSMNGSAFIAVNYFPIIKVKVLNSNRTRLSPVYTNRHTRPASEFFDGRFTIRKK